MDKNLLVLVDGSSYLYRAFHGLPALTNSHGHPTGAIHGVLNMLGRLRSDYPAGFFGVVFDPKGKTLRDEYFPSYKAQRPKMPEDLAVQITPLFSMIRALGYPLIQVSGIEADDVIGTLADQADSKGMRVVISTGDKDFAQLVNKKISLVNTMDKSTLDEEGVMSKFGVRPDQIIDYLTLMGDSVDNIPGVSKVGPKTAVKWLREYGTLEEIIKHAAEITGKVGDNLRESIIKLPLSRRLVTIVKDIDVGVAVEDICLAAPNDPLLRELYTQYELKSALALLGQPNQPALESDVGVDEDKGGDVVDFWPKSCEKNIDPLNYEVILELDVLEEWIAKISCQSFFAFDTETTSLDYLEAKLVGLSFCFESRHAAYLPLSHDYPGVPGQIAIDVALEKLKPLFEDEQIGKLGHNLKYDRHVLLNHGISLKGKLDDSMLESYVLNSTSTRHNLDALALKYLGVATTHYEQVVGKGAKQINFSEVSIDVAAPYAAEDADICWQLHLIFNQMLNDQPKLLSVYKEIELPLFNILGDIEREGVNIDSEMLVDQSAELSNTLDDLEIQAHNLAGEVFNIGSPKQIQAILFDKMELPVLSKTPKGQPSTAESVLQELAHDYPLPGVILKYRSMSKLKSTYTDKLPMQINKSTKRVHTSYHQAVTATGRLSSSDPNLQNIPIRLPEGRRIRKAFKAPPGKTIIAADYSQIELRIMAHLSSDEGLCAAFNGGLDVHRATAAEVFSEEISLVTDDQRRAAKAINFGLIYGMSAFGLAKQLGIDRVSAKRYTEAYFARYPKVLHFMEETKAKAREKEFVETLYGRRLYLPDINARQGQVRQHAERTAINAPMQGTAADIIKLAMIQVSHWMQNSGVHAKIIMQVHDELVIEAETSSLQDTIDCVRSIMESVATLDVPLLVDVGQGANWEEAH
jgi:DNA polymerase I